MFHDLCHTYGSHLAQSGLDRVGVQRQMGHARPSITMDFYVHEFETARCCEQVGELLVAALGGPVRTRNLTKSDQKEGPGSGSGLRHVRNGLNRNGSDGTRTRDLRRDRPAF